MHSDYSIKDCKHWANRNFGKCLSDKYINMKSKLKWRCKNGHEWLATPASIKAGTWCKVCRNTEAGRKRRNSIDTIQALAREKGGRCLSKTYQNAHKKLKWQCKEGHKWEAPYNNVQQGKWCPVCAGISKHSLNTAIDAATLNNGQCLSKTYKNGKTPLRWKCGKGHKWSAPLQNVLGGAWCAECRNNEYLDALKVEAQKRGGTCVAKKYTNQTTLVEFACASGHKFELTAKYFYRGGWCSQCAKEKSLKYSINDMKLIAREKGGECISPKYLGTAKKLTWRCSYGHEWDAKPIKVIRGSWCSSCSSGFGERICRAYFEAAFSEKFPKTRSLSWLTSKEGNRLELDGYCKKLEIAFEYQGSYHYEYNEFFHSTKDEFRKRIKTDKRKEKLCSENGVLLVSVPDILNEHGAACFPEMLGEIFTKFKLTPKKDVTKLNLDLKKIYINRYFDQFQRLKNKVMKKGGTVLSEDYFGGAYKLEFKCNKNHIWSATPTNIMNGKWCPYCSGRKKEFYKILNEIAKTKGGRVLDSKYLGATVKLMFECKLGHKWKAVPPAIMRGQWCKQCYLLSKNKKTKR